MANKRPPVIRYMLRDVWPSLHSLPCWPNEFEVEISDRDYIVNPWLYTPPAELRRLNTVADNRGYVLRSRHDAHNRCLIVWYRMQADGNSVR